MEGVLKENIQQGTLALHLTKFSGASWRIELTDRRLGWVALKVSTRGYPELALEGRWHRYLIRPSSRADTRPRNSCLTHRVPVQQ